MLHQRVLMRNLLLDGLVWSVGKDWSKVSVAWLLIAKPPFLAGVFLNLSLSSRDLLTSEASGLDSYNLWTSVTQLGSISLEGLQQIQVRETCLNCASWSSQDQARSSWVKNTTLGLMFSSTELYGEKLPKGLLLWMSLLFPCELFFSCVCFSWAPK